VAKGPRQGALQQIVSLAKPARGCDPGSGPQRAGPAEPFHPITKGRHRPSLRKCATGSLLTLWPAPAETLGRPFLVLLDGVQDPHNLGGPSSAARGSLWAPMGWVIPKRRAPWWDGSCDGRLRAGPQSSPHSGRVNQSGPPPIDTLKQEGYWVFARMPPASPAVEQDSHRAPVALGWVGSEAFGLSRLVREKCDFLSSHPHRGGRSTSLQCLGG